MEMKMKKNYVEKTEVSLTNKCFLILKDSFFFTLLYLKLRCFEPKPSLYQVKRYKANVGLKCF